jgi:hypothetical protein
MVERLHLGCCGDSSEAARAAAADERCLTFKNWSEMIWSMLATATAVLKL